MTDTTNIETIEQEPQVQEPQVQEQQVQEDTNDRGREAARYRRRLREVETERDALSQRVEAMQRAEAERLAAGQIAKGSALWAAGTTLADLLDDEGNLDPEKVHQAAQSAADELGLSQPSGTPAPDPSQGSKGSDGAWEPASWADALRG